MIRRIDEYFSKSDPGVKEIKEEPVEVKSDGTKSAEHDNQSKKRKIKLKVDAKCSYCIKSFNNTSNLSRHIKALHADKFADSLYKCQFCGQKFHLKYYFDKHLEVKHPGGYKEQYECDICGKIIKDRVNLRSHMKKHYPKRTCHICHKKIMRIDNHLKAVHGTELNFKCNDCPKSFNSQPKLKSHRAYSHEKILECDKCPKKFGNNSLLKTHKKLYHENPRSFKCEICQKGFNELVNLKKHERLHDRFRPKPYRCQKCSYSTDVKQDFIGHEQWHKNREEKFAKIKNPIKCGLCDFVTDQKRKMSSHKAKFHPKRLFYCDLCGLYAKQKQSIKLHIKKIHVKN